MLLSQFFPAASVCAFLIPLDRFPSLAENDFARRLGLRRLEKLMGRESPKS